MLLIVEPYLHWKTDTVDNPLLGIQLSADSKAYTFLRRVKTGELSVADLPKRMRHKLQVHGWLLAEDAATDTRFVLNFVSIEANIACNQGCYFCPVSFAKRKDSTISLDFYEDIVRQLVPYQKTIRGVFMNHYNEPTLDPNFVERIKILHRYGFDIGLLTNGTGLTPKRIDQIIELGGIEHLCVNLSTTDHEQYRKDRQADHLSIVLRNLIYATAYPLARNMSIVVLGEQDDLHHQHYEEIQAKFADTVFRVDYAAIASRSTYLPIGLKPRTPIKHLGGCDQTGSRVLQHLHINAYGECIICCQDYQSEYVVGDLHTETLHNILVGERMAAVRRSVYGRDNAPETFICRNCIFALNAPQ